MFVWCLQREVFGWIATFPLQSTAHWLSFLCIHAYVYQHLRKHRSLFARVFVCGIVLKEYSLCLCVCVNACVCAWIQYTKGEGMGSVVFDWEVCCAKCGVLLRGSVVLDRNQRSFNTVWRLQMVTKNEKCQRRVLMSWNKTCLISLTPVWKTGLG